MTDPIKNPNSSHSAESVVANLKKEYMVVSKGRTHMVYAYLTLSLVLGIGVGIGFVISNGQFQGGQAVSTIPAGGLLITAQIRDNDCDLPHAQPIGECAAQPEEAAYESCMVSVQERYATCQQQETEPEPFEAPN